MIITPDYDQFNTVIYFGDNWSLKNSIEHIDYRFMPRELFNMIQLQILNLFISNKKNRKILNAVSTNLRKNLRNICYHNFSIHYNNLYITMLASYLNGDNI